MSSSGTLNAVTTVLVGSQVSGQIKDLYVDFNTPVKKGQLLARIDPETFELKVRQAEADLDAARTSLLARRGDVAAAQSQVLRAKLTADDGKREADRKKMLVAKGFISAAELDKAVFVEQGAAEAVRTTEAQLRAAEAQVANAEATVKQREAALATARVDLARTSIVAPVDGVVISRQIDAGQTVAASFNTPQLFSIAQDLSQMQVDVSIDESDISGSASASGSPTPSTRSRGGRSTARSSRSARPRSPCRTSSPTPSSSPPTTRTWRWCPA